MGILNLTPDSFSGDGLGHDPASALEQARRFVEAGADLLDIGGESTRPRAIPVGEDEELRRVLPAIEAIHAALPLPLSIDTMKPNVARAALQAGVSIINDVTGLADPVMRTVAAESGVPVVIMHSRGTPQTMADLTDYGGDVVGELERFFEQRVAEVEAAGVSREKIILDPGIGFAKTSRHNLEILHALPRLKKLGYPLLVGVSRKAFIGKLAAGPGRESLPPPERVYGTAAAVALAIAGGADIIRIHDVAALAGAIRVADAITRPNSPNFDWL
jgi:dihydropteroate synthase